MSIRRFIPLFALVVLLFGSQSTLAKIVQKNEDTTAGNAYNDVSSTDLINQGQSTLKNHVRLPAGGFGDNTNDGGGKQGSDEDSEYWRTTSQPNTLTYTLNTTDHTLGYDIKKIVSVTGWAGAEESQANQDFELLVSKVGSEEYTSLGSFSHKPYSDTKGGHYGVRLTLTDDTGTLASGVDAVRFIFAAASFEGKHAGLVIREIDVEGVPTGSAEQ
jgi:hypothetical protein